MRNVAALTKRELVAYFLSPMAYVVVTVCLALSGFWFCQFAISERQADVVPLIGILFWLLLFVCPMLTMRLFADEFQSGTIETLMTAPVTTLEVVVSKYLASLFFLLVILVPTMLHPAILFWFGRGGGGPDAGVVVSAYFGLFLLGSYFVAVGLVASACVRAQVSAAVVSFVVLLTLLVLPQMVSSRSVDWFSQSVRHVCWPLHFVPFTKGVVDTRDVCYFVLSDLFCVFLTAVVVTVRRWR